MGISKVVLDHQEIFTVSLSHIRFGSFVASINIFLEVDLSEEHAAELFDTCENS